MVYKFKVNENLEMKKRQSECVSDNYIIYNSKNDNSSNIYHHSYELLINYITDIIHVDKTTLYYEVEKIENLIKERII